MHGKKTKVKEIQEVDAENEEKLRAQETTEKRLKLRQNVVGMFPPCDVRWHPQTVTSPLTSASCFLLSDTHVALLPTHTGLCFQYGVSDKKHTLTLTHSYPACLLIVALLSEALEHHVGFLQLSFVSPSLWYLPRSHKGVRLAVGALEPPQFPALKQLLVGWRWLKKTLFSLCGSGRPIRP